MVSMSTLSVPEQVLQAPCHQIFHPWTKNCLYSMLDMMLGSAVGSGTFFALMFLFQHIINSIKKQKRQTRTFKELGYDYFRASVLFGASEATLFVTTSCLLRRLLGRFYTYSMVFLPASVGGLTIGFEDMGRKLLITNVFCNMVLQTMVHRLEQKGRFQWKPMRQTVAFMMLSSVLSGLMHRFEDDSEKPRCFWIFMPLHTKHKSPSKHCWHSGSCKNLILGGFTKYFIMGLLLQSIKVLFSKARDIAEDPYNLINIILDKHLYNLAGFLAFYYGLYQSTKCYMFRRSKELSCEEEMLAGLVAGAAFTFLPSVTIFNSALITVVQMITCFPCIKKYTPRLPYPELLYALCSGYLFHCRAFHEDQVPRLMTYTMSTVTGGRCDYIVKNLTKTMQVFLAQ